MDQGQSRSSKPDGSHSGLFFYPWERPFERLITPFEEFIHRQTTSGIVLILTTLVALALANSPLGAAYGRILETTLSISLGFITIGKDLVHWVNEGLMVFFFLLVGCEIKREILVGDLADIRMAALPIVAAAGGMILPALIYFLFNPTGNTVQGWGIPMATDIAFCISALVLLGKRVPSALTLFLVSLAIVDDLGAVLVIALFYTDTVNLQALAFASLSLATLVLFNMAGIRRLTPYGLVGFCMWLALLYSGIHATLTGVLLAFCLPARPRYDTHSFSKRMKQLVGDFTGGHQPNDNLLKNKEQYSLLRAMMDEVRLTETPIQRVQNALDVPSALIVIPLFALANAGIPIIPSALSGILSHSITQGVLFGLIAGKCLGITGFSWIALKMGIGKLPRGIRLSHIVGAGLLAGIGFTMSIFIAELSFPGHEDLLNVAKTGIILSSIISGILGVGWLWILALARRGESSKAGHEDRTAKARPGGRHLLNSDRVNPGNRDSILREGGPSSSARVWSSRGYGQAIGASQSVHSRLDHDDASLP